MSVVIDVARREWEDGYRRFEAASRDPVAADRLSAQLEVVTAELRRRIGQTFTLEELVAHLRAGRGMGRDSVSEHAPTPGWPRTLASWRMRPSTSTSAARSTTSRERPDPGRAERTPPAPAAPGGDPTSICVLGRPAFSLGVALGQAMNDNPRPAGQSCFDLVLHIPTAGKPGLDGHFLSCGRGADSSEASERISVDRPRRGRLPPRSGRRCLG